MLLVVLTFDLISFLSCLSTCTWIHLHFTCAPVLCLLFSQLKSFWNSKIRNSNLRLTLCLCFFNIIYCQPTNRVNYSLQLFTFVCLIHLIFSQFKFHQNKIISCFGYGFVSLFFVYFKNFFSKLQTFFSIFCLKLFSLNSFTFFFNLHSSITSQCYYFIFWILILILSLLKNLLKLIALKDSLSTI